MIACRRRVAGGTLLLAAAGLHGCAVTPYAPSVAALPGPQASPPQYQADDSTCRQSAQAQVAPAADAANGQAAGSALLGAAAGAAIGALIGYGSYGGYGHYAGQSAATGAGIGLMYGGAVGAGGSQAANVSLQQRYDVAYAQCMASRGYRVSGPGYGYRAAPAYPVYPPPPPGYTPPRAVPPPAPPMPPGVPPPNTPPPV
jgi:hypothetical protein